MTLRKIVLSIHLYFGLAAGIFLVVLGLTGSVMALEEDLTHWLHPDLWYVKAGAKPLPENDLVSTAQNRFLHARVLAVEFPQQANLAQVIHMTDSTVVYMNPYNAAVLGTSVGRSNSDLALEVISRIHLGLIPDPTWASTGKTILSLASVVLCLLVATGLVLWWRDKRLFMSWEAANFKVPWFKLFHDAHRVIGLYVSLFLMIAAFTGILIGFSFGPKMFYSITRSSPPPAQPFFPSTPIPDTPPILSDQALDAARHALPNASVFSLLIPPQRIGSFVILMRMPQETSRAVRSFVIVDQYSGKMLHAQSYLDNPAGYRWIRFNRSIHTGDIFGFPSRLLVSLSSLLLVAMVITGMVVWWKKLAS